MNGGAITLVLLAFVAALVLFVGGLFLFARFAGGRGMSIPVPCCFRVNDQEPWRKGTLRYDHDRLDHYGAGGLSMRPEHRWERSLLDLGLARVEPSPDCPGLPAGMPATTVSCRYGEQTFELALGHQHYTALRSWLESVPPGWNANVA